MNKWKIHKNKDTWYICRVLSNSPGNTGAGCWIMHSTQNGYQHALDLYLSGLKLNLPSKLYDAEPWNEAHTKERHNS